MLGAVLLLTACTTGSTEEPDGRPRRDIAATPESLPPLPSGTGPSASAPGPGSTASGRPATPGTSGAPGASGGPGASTAPSGSGSPAPGGGTPSAGGPGTAPFRPVASNTDRPNDAGSPPYADLTGVALADDGTNVRVTVTFAADLPSRVGADEVMGVGVDFYRTTTQIESDYQLFADGQPDGWYAYLQTPRGFVKYPGTFGIGGNRLVFTVPWSALGSPVRGAFSGFADWTRAATPTNQAGEDRSPDLAVNTAYAR